MSKPIYPLLLLAAISLSACDAGDGPAEKAGRAIDNAADKAGKAVERAGEKIQDAARDARK